jgi:prophage regulatory protein
MADKTLRSALAIKRRRQVESQCGISRSTLYSRIKAGTFPPAVPVGKRAVGWLSHEVDAVIHGQIRGLDDSSMRLLVDDLVAARAAYFE